MNPDQIQRALDDIKGTLTAIDSVPSRRSIIARSAFRTNCARCCASTNSNGTRNMFGIESLQPRIPTGFRPKAQGCEGRATLGKRRKESNPKGVVAVYTRAETGPEWPQPRCG